MNSYGRLVVFLFLLPPGVALGHGGGEALVLLPIFATFHVLNMVAYYLFLKNKYIILSLLTKHRSLFAIVGAILMPVVSGLFTYLIGMVFVSWVNDKIVLSIGAYIAGPILVWVMSIVFFYIAKD